MQFNLYAISTCLVHMQRSIFEIDNEVMNYTLLSKQATTFHIGLDFRVHFIFHRQGKI